MNRSSTSPFRGVSGVRSGSSQSVDMLIRTLEQENNALAQEISVLKAKGKKANELQDKIDMILRHNTQLLNQNQRLAKLINQKKSQIDIWKNKHDTLIANRSTASDLQVKRLLGQIQKLKQETSEIEHKKNLQINEIKNCQYGQIQSIKKNNLNNIEKYQLEIRKLKEYCDKKEYELSELKMRIARIGKQSEFEINKLKEERQRLKLDLIYEENEHKKELETVKNKLQFNLHSQIQNLKKQHFNQIETMDYQNTKLKEVIGSKNIELEQSISKQTKMRNHFEDSIEIVKKENNQLKEKIVENEHLADLQLNNLREKLENIRTVEVTLLRQSTNNEMDILNRQIAKLRKFLEGRNAELEHLSKERNQMRQILESEIEKMKGKLVMQLNDKKQVVFQYEEKLKICDEDLKYKNEEMKNIENYFNNQIQIFKKEKSALSALLDGREKQLQTAKKQSGEVSTQAQSQLKSLKEQHSQARQQLERSLRRATSDFQHQKKDSNYQLQQLQTLTTNLSQQSKQKDILIEQLKQNTKTLEKQLKATYQNIEYLQQTEKQLRGKIKENLTHSNQKEKELNKLIKEQIENMERMQRNQIEELKSIQDNKIRTFRYQIKELQRQIEDKNKMIGSIKSKYEELINSFEKVFAQQASRKKLDLKVPGCLPESLALKSVFDVFVKNKVLEYCS